MATSGEGDPTWANLAFLPFLLLCGTRGEPGGVCKSLPPVEASLSRRKLKPSYM